MVPEPLPAERLLPGRFGDRSREEWVRHQGVKQTFVYGSAPGQSTTLIVLRARLEAADSRINQCIGWSCIAGQRHLRMLSRTKQRKIGNPPQVQKQPCLIRITVEQHFGQRSQRGSFIPCRDMLLAEVADHRYAGTDSQPVAVNNLQRAVDTSVPVRQMQHCLSVTGTEVTTAQIGR